MEHSFDIAVIGSGFAGSLMAMVARRLGRSVIMLERGRHPRFAIGESSTPLANLLLEEFATQYDLPRLLPLTKWGSWQREYPQVACGLKRGFTFLHHQRGESFECRPDRSNQLLVAASPNDHVADTQWFRAEVDQFLVGEAQAIGVNYLDEVTVRSIHFQPGGAKIEALRRGDRVALTARWVIDATGPHGFLVKQLALGHTPIADFPATQSLYAHFRGVGDCRELIAGPMQASPPYPPDSAAVHHMFDGGWVWSLRFNNGITSAGVMATAPLAAELRLPEGEPAWRRLLERFPTLQHLFGGAQPVGPFIHAPSIAFRAGKIAGPGWTLLPSAAGFVDPLLSTGFPLALLGIHRLGKLLKDDWDSDRWTSGLERYARDTSAELDATARLVAALYSTMPDFRRFVPMSLTYFAAASFSEAARRLGKPEMAGGFLLHDHSSFGPAMRRCCEAAAHSLDAESLMDQVKKAIAPIDIAGLGRSDRAHWYPVDPQDTLIAAGKLGVGVDSIKAMLERCGVCFSST